MSAAGKGAGLGASRLVRLLGAWGVAESPPLRQDFAERLSLWLGPMDAMRLRALQPSLRPVSVPLRLDAGVSELVEQALATAERVHAELARRIAVAGRFEPDPDDAAAVPLSPDDTPSYAPYRLAYLDWQRELEATIGATRAQLRQVLARVASQRPLATLDAVLEPMTAARAQKLWGQVPQWLAQRFRHWHDQAPATDAASAPGAHSAWLARFEQDWTAALLAELDARWEPVQGLMDAWRNETDTTR